MTNPLATPATTPVRLSRLDIVVARHAHAHGHGSHATPIVGCYQCLHGVEVPAAGRVFKLAA